jgi:lipoprotein-anchoring transpeptidase ErfK/SrfK
MFRVGIYFSCALCILALISCVNSVSVFAETIQENGVSAEKYTLTLEERYGIKEQIKGTDIKLKYGAENSQEVSFDQDLLKACIDKLSCLDSSKIIEPQDARLTYDNNNYMISKEVYGNKVNKDILYDNIVKAIENKDKTLDLEAKNCYENPKIFENSQEIINARDTANKYLSSYITYKFAGLTWILDGSTIKDWISLDSNLQIVLDESKVREYVDALANAYTSELGNNIPVSGGYDGNNHGWIIDSSQETAALIDNIKNGQTITKSPIYAQTAIASYFNNVGATYVEIDMTKQHVWFYKDGYLVVEGDVVTGNKSNGDATPAGIYKLYSKQKDTVLRGEDYAAPVSFWMPFNRNIGLHDANWRSEFGGEIYKTNGSHGCVNLPYDVAKSIYYNINIGTPVICYYS